MNEEVTVNEQMNRMSFQVGGVLPTLLSVFVILLLCEALLDLLEINDALFTIHVLWHSPQTTDIQISQSMAHRPSISKYLGCYSKLLTPGPHFSTTESEFLGMDSGSCTFNTIPGNSMV